MPDSELDENPNIPLNVELVPELWRADVTGRLSQSIARCSDFRGAVAFWTIDHGRVNAELADRASKQGFLCVDINSPTDLDRIDQLAEEGANVFLHLKSPSNQMEDSDAGNYAMPKHLMHAKFLLFDFPDGVAEIWSGSHNWTRRSLLGPNIEISMILTVSQESRIYQEALDNLEMIRELCIPFRHEDLDYYKFLQRSERSKTVPVIELEGNDVDPLSQTSIELFGTDTKYLGELDSTNRRVILAITDSEMKPAALSVIF